MKYQCREKGEMLVSIKLERQCQEGRAGRLEILARAYEENSFELGVDIKLNFC